MPITLSVTFTPKRSRNLDLFVGKWKENAIRGVNKATLRLERQVKIELSKGGGFRRAKGRPWEPNTGKHLRVGDDTLRSSWLSRPALAVGNDVEGHVATWVPYSAIHEYGGLITIGARSFIRGRKAVKEGREGARLSQGKSIGATTVRIPERPYVRPALKAVRAKMRRDIMDELKRPLQ